MSEATKRVIEYLHKENEELKAKCDLLEKALEMACLELCNLKPVINGKLATIEMHKKRLLNHD